MEILTAILTAGGVLLFLWCVTGLLLFPVCGEDTVLVWHMAAPCPELEYRLRGVLWLLRTGLCGARLVLVDCGLSEEDRRRVIWLTEQEPAVTLTDETNWMETVQSNGAGTGTDTGDRALGDLSESRERLYDPPHGGGRL